MADGFQISGDVTATTTGAGIWYTPTATSTGSVVGNMRPLYFVIASASSNTADSFIDITGGAVVATSSAGYRLRPGKSFPPFPAERPGSNAGYSGFSAIQAAGTTAVFLSYAAWR